MCEPYTHTYVHMYLAYPLTLSSQTTWYGYQATMSAASMQIVHGARYAPLMLAMGMFRHILR